MKRIGYLYDKIYDINNLILADKKARKGKLHQKEIQNHIINEKKNLEKLHLILKNNDFKNAKYKIFTIKDPKERQIFKLPYFPDRIVHHAIMNIIENIFVKSFTKNTYSCIKGRGIHKGLYDLKRDLKNVNETTFCLKLDIKKFYPSINNEILKKLLRKKFKDKYLLLLLDNIIDSTTGLPIGNYLSQILANFYLNYFDHWIKEEKNVKYYYRYCDDIVILSDSKEFLHGLFREIEQYLQINLKLEINNKHQVFPVKSRGIDFLGYKFYHTHILLRKSIKLRFISMLKNNKNTKSIASYNGWLSHCNSKNLTNKYLKNEKI